MNQSEGGKKYRGSPPRSPEEQEQRMIALAVRQAEKQLEEGTAPPSMVLHYLKLATTREALEQERLRKENLMLEAKTESLATASRTEEMFKQALEAFTSYKTDDDEED